MRYSISIGDWATIKTESLPENVVAETSHSTGIIGNIAGDVIRVDLESEAGVVPVEVGEEDIRPARQIKLDKADLQINELTIEDKFGDMFSDMYGEKCFEGYAAVADYQLWLDVDAYFGTQTRDDDSTWINFYTEYDENGVLGAYYVISSDDNEEIHAWELTGEEKAMFMELLNEKAKKEGYTDIGDFLISELKEMDEPEKE